VQASNRAHSPREWRGRTALLAVIGALATLAIPASTQAASKFTIVSHFPNHTPTANTGWKITLDVTKGKTKLSGSGKYEFEFSGTVVSRQPGKKFTNGLYKDTLTFPSSAVGEPLTLVVLITTKYGTESVSWSVNAKQ
jgi:hypothetical protein